MKKLYGLAGKLGFDRGLAYVAIGNLLYTGVGAILWFFLASWLTAANYGQLSYEISVASVLTAVGLLGFDTTLITFLAKGINRMIGESSFLVLAGSIVLSIIIFLLFSSISLVSLTLGMIFFSLVTAELLGKHLFKKFMILLIIQRVLTLILVPSLYYIYGIDGAVVGFAISHLVLCYRYFLNLKHINFSISTILPIRNFFFHSYALGIAKALPYFSDKLIILPIFGVVAVGYYQFGVQMLTVISIIPVILYNYLLPKEASGKNQNSIKTIKLGLFSAVVMSVTLIIFMPLIIKMLFPSFELATLPTQIILLAGVPLAVTAIYNSILMAAERSNHVIIGACTFLILQYSLIVLLGSIFGLMGLSVAMVIASTIQCIYLILMKKRIFIDSKSISGLVK